MSDLKNQLRELLAAMDADPQSAPQSPPPQSPQASQPDMARLATSVEGLLGEIRNRGPQPIAHQIAPRPSGPPISDKGPATSTPIPNWRIELRNNPLSMSKAAREEMDNELGATAARQKRVEVATRLHGNMRVTFRPTNGDGEA